MYKSKLAELRPFLSVLVIISSLFSVVFIKMEVRRVGYSVLKESRSYKKLNDEKRKLVIQLARVTRPARLRKIAVSQLTLDDAKIGQVIQMAGTKIALRQ